METSKFLIENTYFDKVELIKETSAFSRLYKLRVDGRLYFMKLLREEYAADPRYRSMFFKEYEAGKSISCPYVTEYISINEDSNGLYIIMDYVNGVTLKEKLHSEPEYFRNEKNLYLLIGQLLMALSEMHSKNIIHLDLAPSNILLSKADNCVKLVDLGFSISDTNDFTAGCTKDFAAPETLVGDVRDIDNRSDIYVLGCILQYIETETGIRLSGKLQEIKERCLQNDKKKRYQSVGEILSAVKYRKYIKAGKVATLFVGIVALLAGFLASPLYDMLYNYVSWEMGRFPARFCNEGIYYNVTSRSARTVEVTFKGNSPSEFEYEYNTCEVIIPSTVTYKGREFRVTSIAGQAFMNPYISKVTIPDGVEVLADSALYGCLLADTLFIPKSVTYIGSVAIYPMCHIKGFTVDEGNTVYDSRNGCNAIIETATNTLLAGCEATVIPHGVTAIASNAFMGVENLVHIDIPAAVTSIGENAFVHCGLREMKLPDGVTELKQYTFQYCGDLSKIEFPENLTSIGVAALSHCAFVEIVIPDSVTAIGQYAFDYNEKLERVVIGKGVRVIGNYAFDGCRNLTSVVSHIPADELFEVSSNVFGNVGEDCVLYVPRGAGSVYRNTHGWNVFTTIVEL